MKIIIASAVPEIVPADVTANAGEIRKLIAEAAEKGAAALYLPSNCISGNGCGSLHGTELLENAINDASTALWNEARKTGIRLEFCNVAVPALAGSHKRLAEECRTQSEGGKVVVQCNPGDGESTGSFVYDGAALICADGKILAESERFPRGSRLIFAEVDAEAPVSVYEPAVREGLPAAAESAHPFVPGRAGELKQRCEEIFNIQTVGLATRLRRIGCRSAVIGISGGLDSTLALLVCAAAFDRLDLPRKNICAVTMPGFGTSGRTRGNAFALMEKLGVDAREINISKSVLQHLEDIGHDSIDHNVTYENAQARERTQILMDLANDLGGIVVGTGDLSESALGWCTFNGDHISMYNPNCDVPKTLMQAMVRNAAAGAFCNVADTLTDIVDTPISPELLPGAQVTEDLVGPYELHDFFLYQTVRLGRTPSGILDAAQRLFEGTYTRETIRKWLAIFIKRFFSAQFKRNCCADGPAVGSVRLSPTAGFAFASDLSPRLWLSDLDL